MRKCMIYLFCSLLIFSTTALEAKDEKKDDKKDIKTTKTEVKPAPVVAKTYPQKTKYTIDEDILQMFFDEPEEHFVKARNSLARKDIKETNYELKKAITFLKLEAMRASSDNEKAIKSVISEVEKLLSDMEKSTIGVSIRRLAENMKQDALKVAGDSAKALQVSSAELVKLADQMEDTAPRMSSPEILDPIVARGHSILVKHHLAKSKESLSKKENKYSGNDLEAAADHLARAYQWLNKDADGGTKSTFKDSRTLANKLSQGNSASIDEFIKIQDSLYKEVEKIYKLIETAKK